MKRVLFLVGILLLMVVPNVSVQARADVNFLVVSDLGNYGGDDQPLVAESMGNFAHKFKPTAILNLGDTFHYWGVQSIDDPSWNNNFESIYSHPALYNLWYSVLGNHDYQGNSQALIDYTEKSRRWNLPDRYYTKKFKEGDTSVEIIFLDTTPMLRRARNNPDKYPDAQLQDTTAQIQWLRRALAQADADWVIVAAHHPLFSERDDTSLQRADINSHLGLALASRRPDFYINGDLHGFEHIKRPGDTTDYVTCTSGSRAFDIPQGENTKYSSGFPGFISMTFDKNSATVIMYGRDGSELYRFTKEKNK